MKALISIEKQIIWRVILALLEDGYIIQVNDGEEICQTPTRDPGTIFVAMRSTDEDYLITNKSGKKTGWVHFIYGNDGHDVINDYTVNLEHIMAPISGMIDRYLEEEG